MNSVIAIPAREASKRIKEKPLVKILGIPAIKWTVQTALKNTTNSAVVVCSDSQMILDSIKNEKVTCNLSLKKYHNGTNRVFDYLLHDKTQWSSIIVFDCGEITIRPETLDELSRLVSSGSFEIATCIQEISGFDIADANVVKATLSSGNELLYLSRSPIPYPTNIESTKGIKFWKQVGVTCYNLEVARKIFNSKRCDAEIVEDIDLLSALNCRLRIGTVKIAYNRVPLNSEDSIPMIESLISSERVKSGKPPGLVTLPSRK